MTSLFMSLIIQKIVHLNSVITTEHWVLVTVA